MRLQMSGVCVYVCSLVQVCVCNCLVRLALPETMIYEGFNMHHHIALAYGYVLYACVLCVRALALDLW